MRSYFFGEDPGTAFEMGQALNNAGPVKTARIIVAQAEAMAAVGPMPPAALRTLADQQDDFWREVTAELRRMADEREH